MTDAKTPSSDPDAKLEPTGEVAIPSDILVSCPLREFKQRHAAKCEGCQYFHGLLDRFPGSEEFEFAERYLVRCGGPVSRRLMRLEMADD